MSEVLTPAVLVVGGGPAGLTAAASLARAGTGPVLVLDREREAGGIPRHSDHPGYGLRDLRRFVSGPEYAHRLVDRALAAGAVVRTEAMVTSWTPTGSASVTTPQGRLEIAAGAVVLATGARERPRAARLVPGDRPRGVYTTGQLQNLVHLHHGVPGTRAVVVGAELVSWSAVLTLREAGCRTVLMTTTHRRPESYAAFTVAGRTLLRTPVAPTTRVVRLVGLGRLEAVEVENTRTGARRTVDCDTVVFTGDWIPDSELARQADLLIDPGTRGPLVDAALRTSRPGFFAAGNVIHPVDTADVAALDGRHLVAPVQDWLGTRRWRADGVRLRPEAPLQWVSPGVVDPAAGTPARGRLLLSTGALVRRPTVVLRQGGTVIARRRLPWPASPGRVFRVPSAILGAVEPAAGDVTIALG
ncbi:MAG TPA: FAD-dependent oxidoreductase [Jatrophihabitans sp.]|jgi:thioredoxin reductase|uniref:NAD(P)/FAD-dependent oxidoreductase n=1 Tax=Jatrophihabitans sp. TaxID=1932789 RepID=UPI002E010898|nr:FAD-dependent oxidoreductase [Jatrophihabitans sp.]